jgi:hypothetical protein
MLVQETQMNTIAKMMIAVSLAALPVAASAQSATNGDLAYCRALSDTYARYVGHGELSNHNDRFYGDLDSQVALSKCHEGDAKAAIPVLERTLARNGITLPPRS